MGSLIVGLDVHRATRSDPDVAGGPTPKETPMSGDVFGQLVALYKSLPPEPTQAQLVAVREAFGRLLGGYEPATPEERSAIDDMADSLASTGES